MFGARKRNEAQIAPRLRGGELGKGRVVESRKLHSTVDRLSVDGIQRRGGPFAASLRINGSFGRLNFVQIRI